MTKAKLVWPPYPYKAGFCLTDDTDAATFEQVKVVYDFLLAHSFRTTKTVWAFKPMDRCGIPPLPDSALRGITLEDPSYLDYCRKLHENGFEICLHGASAGNNPREYTLKAFDFVERHIGPFDTFICHGKNADNLYWEHKVTSLPVLRGLLERHSKHTCNGEIESSPFFWGDLCKERISQIRLFRTRRIDTLRSNPSMPYFDRRKPYVNAWFSATKRRIMDCATPHARATLKRHYGLTVLYQYLFRYTDPKTLMLDPRFTKAVSDIADDREILVDTVSHIMRRLRLIQGVFLAYDRHGFWLINTNHEDIPNVQVATTGQVPRVSSEHPVNIHEATLVLPALPALGIVFVETGRVIRFRGQRCGMVDRHRHVTWTLPAGTLFVNLSQSPWAVGDLSVKAHSFVAQWQRRSNDRVPLSHLTTREELRLVFGQLWIIAREILLRRRPIDVNAYLDDSKEIKLENHDNW